MFVIRNRLTIEVRSSSMWMGNEVPKILVFMGELAIRVIRQWE